MLRVGGWKTPLQWSISPTSEMAQCSLLAYSPPCTTVVPADLGGLRATEASTGTAAAGSWIVAGPAPVVPAAGTVLAAVDGGGLHHCWNRRRCCDQRAWCCPSNRCRARLAAVVDFVVGVGHAEAVIGALSRAEDGIDGGVGELAVLAGVDTASGVVLGCGVDDVAALRHGHVANAGPAAAIASHVTEDLDGSCALGVDQIDPIARALSGVENGLAADGVGVWRLAWARFLAAVRTAGTAGIVAINVAVTVVVLVVHAVARFHALAACRRRPAALWPPCKGLCTRASLLLAKIKLNRSRNLPAIPPQSVHGVSSDD